MRFQNILRMIVNRNTQKEREKGYPKLHTGSFDSLYLTSFFKIQNSFIFLVKRQNTNLKESLRMSAFIPIAPNRKKYKIVVISSVRLIQLSKQSLRLSSRLSASPKHRKQVEQFKIVRIRRKILKSSNMH